jgi:Flp pilus assembly pilin Flp
MNRKKALSSIEYAVLIIVVVAALIGMSVYLKHAILGKWRDAGDMFGQGRQYDVLKGGGAIGCLSEGVSCPQERGVDCCAGLICTDNSHRNAGKCVSCVDSCDAAGIGKFCCGGGTCTSKYAGCAAEHRGVCTRPLYNYVCQ